MAKKKIKVRKTTRKAPGVPGATHVDLGTKYDKKPKYRKTPRQKKVTVEGLDLVRQINDEVREMDPVEKALHEMDFDFEISREGEMDEMVEYMRELLDTGEAEDTMDAANRACDQMELYDDEEREKKIGQLYSAYEAIYGEDTGESDLDEPDLDATGLDR